MFRERSVWSSRSDSSWRRGSPSSAWRVIGPTATGWLLRPRARRAHDCFDPYHDDAQDYARATALVPTSCEDEVVSMLGTLRAKAPAYREDGRDAYFNAEQNALVARNAELYYRTMVRGGPTS